MSRSTQPRPASARKVGRSGMRGSDATRSYSPVQPLRSEEWGLARIPIPADLPSWLCSITPLGAPALGWWPNGERYVWDPFPLPLTAARPGPKWLERLLPRILIPAKSGGQRPLHSDAVEHLRLLLDGRPRTDGLPGWDPVISRDSHSHDQGWMWERGEPTEADVSLTEKDAREAHLRARETAAEMRARRTITSRQQADEERETVISFSLEHNTAPWKRDDRGIGRSLHAAVLRDVCGPISRKARGAGVSRALGLTDHETAEHVDASAARTYAALGRKIFAVLGAWPWAHCDGQALPPDWRSSSVFIEPLQEWFISASEEHDVARHNAIAAWHEAE